MADQGGRPPWIPTKAQRKKVEELISCGMSVEDVAHVIGVSHPTLRDRCAEEISGGRAKKRAEVIALLYRTARKGNVTAQKHLEAMTGMVAPGGTKPKDAKPPKLGKKVEAQIEAANADQESDWGDLVRH